MPNINKGSRVTGQDDVGLDNVHDSYRKMHCSDNGELVKRVCRLRERQYTTRHEATSQYESYRDSYRRETPALSLA